MIHHVRPTVKRIRVYSPTPAHRERFAARMAGELECEVRAVESPADAVRGADIVITATNVDRPVVPDKAIRPGHTLPSWREMRSSRRRFGAAAWCSRHAARGTHSIRLRTSRCQPTRSLASSPTSLQVGLTPGIATARRRCSPAARRLRCGMWPLQPQRSMPHAQRGSARRSHYERWAQRSLADMIRALSSRARRGTAAIARFAKLLADSITELGALNGAWYTERDHSRIERPPYQCSTHRRKPRHGAFEARA